MDYDYNPQLGYKRTLFTEEYDFLIGVHGCQLQEDGLKIIAATHRGRKAVVKVSFLTDTVFRLQMFPEGSNLTARNPVFALDSPKMRTGNEGEGPEREREDSGVCGKVPGNCGEGSECSGKDRECVEHPVLMEQNEWIEYGTDALQLRFRRDYWELSIYSGGKLLTKEQIFDTNVDNRWKTLPIGFRCDDQGRWTSVWENMYLYSDEAFWGFGERFTDFNKRGQHLTCWQKDALSTNTEDSYKGHPFFMSSRGYAVLMNTFTRCTFDMGSVSSVGYQMTAEDGYLDYIFLAEPSGDYKKLLQQYISLTGAIPMIPKWAFGFWQSRCTYQSREEIEAVVNHALQEELPIDVIHIDFWQKEGYLGCWEWDTQRFPDPEGMIRWLNDRHVHLSIWNYPYVTEDSAMFAELAAREFFVKDREGNPAMFYAMADAEYKAACFDFTNPEVVKWYKEKVSAVLKMGVSVIKTDFSEAVPEDAVYYDSSTGVEGHNRLTYLYAQTVYDTMQQCRENCTAGEAATEEKRSGKQQRADFPLLWGRSGYAGSHRIPAAWAGDSSSALNNHSAILRGGLSIALSGVSFWGFDLGGFYNTAPNGNECPPTEEEYLRSVEMGMLMPLARAHGKTPREPWNISERALQIVRDYDRMRHRMVPYLYSAACESHLEGVPMLRPLLLEYPKDFIARVQELSYMLGRSLLVAPPFDREEYGVYLPEGKWLNLLSGEILTGQQFVTAAPTLEQIPVFQRADSILPLVQQKDVSYVPEGSFRDMEVQLFYVGKGRTCGISEGIGEEARLANEYTVCQVCTETGYPVEGADQINDLSMTAVFYDQTEDGQIRSYYFRAYEDAEHCLWLETDMDAAKVTVRSEKVFEGIYLNGVKTAFVRK